MNDGKKIKDSGTREQFSSSLGFVLAMAGAAIGLGNIWKFPYVTGMNGGGAFVLVYLVCIFLIGIPLLICEMSIGRKTRKNPYDAFKTLGEGRNQIFMKILGVITVLSGLFMMANGNYGFGVISVILGAMAYFMGFKFTGLMQIAIPIIILSYYSVVGGWAVNYTYKSFARKLLYTTPEDASAVFGNIVTNVSVSVTFQLIFLLLCAFVIFRGVQAGIERWSKILMPVLGFLLVVLIIRNMFLPNAMDGVSFFLKPDFAQLSTKGWLEALGHSFYTLSIGIGINITFGSYLKKDTNIVKASCQIVLFDTVASILAGLAIFTAVFAMGFKANGGPKLIFEVLPAAFNNMPGGTGFIWSGLFFLSLTIAALTSGISMIEIPTSFLMDRFKMKRSLALIICFTVIALLGVLSSASVANWDNLQGVKTALDTLFGAEHVKGNFFDVLDVISSNWALTISGFLTAVCVGWCWGTKGAAKEFKANVNKFLNVNLLDLISGVYGKKVYDGTHKRGLTLITLWAVLIKFIIPVIILIIFLNTAFHL